MKDCSVNSWSIRNEAEGLTQGLIKQPMLEIDIDARKQWTHLIRQIRCNAFIETVPTENTVYTLGGAYYGSHIQGAFSLAGASILAYVQSPDPKHAIISMMLRQTEFAQKDFYNRAQSPDERGWAMFLLVSSAKAGALGQRIKWRQESLRQRQATAN